MKKIFVLLFVTLFSGVSFICAEDKVIFFDKNSDAGKRSAGVLMLGGTVKMDLPEINAVVATFDKAKTKGPSMSFADFKRSNSSVLGFEDDEAVNWLQSGSFDTSIKRTSGSGSSLREISSNPGKRAITSIGNNKVSQPKNDMWKVDLYYPTTTNDTPPSAKAQKVPWGIEWVQAPEAWSHGLTGRGVVVAVVDTGIKLDHPDLKDNIINSYTPYPKFISGGGGDDKNGHGTHVAGTIAAKNNDIGVVGVAPDAKLLAVRVLGPGGMAFPSMVAAGILWAANNGAQVINLSLGSPKPKKIVELAINYAASKNITIVCASGNGGTKNVNYPAAYGNTIAVTASDIRNRFAIFSDSGKEINFIAPGVKILSTSTLPSGYEAMDGTSMAAPHVAGLAALAIEAGAKTPSEVLAKLKAAARPLPGITAEQQGSGFIKGKNISK